MGLIETEMNELRGVLKRIDLKTMSDDELHQRMLVYTQMEKRERLVVQVATLGCKYGPKRIEQLRSSNLIGDGSVIDVDTDMEKDTVRCPLNEKIITRGQCLDFSGLAANIDKCEGCRNYSVTRRKLLGDKNGN